MKKELIKNILEELVVDRDSPLGYSLTAALEKHLPADDDVHPKHWWKGDDIKGKTVMYEQMKFQLTGEVYLGADKTYLNVKSCTLVDTQEQDDFLESLSNSQKEALTKYYNPKN